ncbi:ABC transporter ATP-binding protein [Actinomyces ruminicola]|uniref:ABC transporter n=1 Tax=Actinomyces ruminicola TaxID=332524 RepID=A0A1G9WRE7_9ACTO|nr:ABC transporter ATP-binding protein [Actinomyces ruminicola]SDM86781.1 ABC transporter [Actinomyces ruminicola]
MSRRHPEGLVAHGPVGDAVVTARNLSKIFGDEEQAVTALESVDAHIARGRFTAVLGTSGSGKTTLLRCLAGLEPPTSGTIILDGEEISLLNQRRLTRLRRERVGLIFQSHNLVPSLSVAENITLPLDLARRHVDPARLNRIADVVSMRGRLDYRPAELSAGQAQRVACARALIGAPAVVFADEPTGALGSQDTTQLLGILRAAVDELEQSIVLATHDADVAARADTVIFLQDGNIVAEMNQPNRDRLLDALHDLGDTGASGIGVGRTEREVSQVEEAWSQPLGAQGSPRSRSRSSRPRDWEDTGERSRPGRGARAYDASPHDWDDPEDRSARPGRRSSRAPGGDGADSTDPNNPWGYQ